MPERGAGAELQTGGAQDGPNVPRRAAEGAAQDGMAAVTRPQPLTNERQLAADGLALCSRPSGDGSRVALKTRGLIKDAVGG